MDEAVAWVKRCPNPMPGPSEIVVDGQPHQQQRVELERAVVALRREVIGEVARVQVDPLGQSLGEARTKPLVRRRGGEALPRVEPVLQPAGRHVRGVVADLERVCDYLVLLAGGRVRLAGPIEELLAEHRRLSGPRKEAPAGAEVVSASHTDRQATYVVRVDQPILEFA